MQSIYDLFTRSSVMDKLLKKRFLLKKHVFSEVQNLNEAHGKSDLNIHAPTYTL